MGEGELECSVECDGPRRNRDGRLGKGDDGDVDGSKT